MRTEEFDYHLPPELIAQTPLPRGESRLLVLNRRTGAIDHKRFSDFPTLLSPGDTVVLNDTRVIARRVTAWRENGLPAEALILRPTGELESDALVRPGRGFRPGSVIELDSADGSRIPAVVIGSTAEGGRRVRFT